MRGEIVVRELADKPGRYVVVEEIHGNVFGIISGVQGQSKDDAERIAQMERDRR